MIDKFHIYSSRIKFGITRLEFLRPYTCSRATLFKQCLCQRCTFSVLRFGKGLLPDYSVWFMVNLQENNVCMTIGYVKNSYSRISCHCLDCSVTLDLAEILFEICSHCGCTLKEMSTIGQSAFAVCKIRQNNEKQLTKMQIVDHEKGKFYDEQYMLPTPMKYNSKMMNSIWGMYNRYSVHNFKKNIDLKMVNSSAVNQQSQTVGSTAHAGGERSNGDVKTAKSPQLLPSFLSPCDYSY